VSLNRCTTRIEVDPAIIEMIWHKVKRASVSMELKEDVEKRRAMKFKGAQLFFFISSLG